jgi:hypothetical protein
LKEQDSKLAEAQKAQAEVLRKQRELDDAKPEIDLTIQKQVQAELTGVREKARKEAKAVQRCEIATRLPSFSMPARAAR